MPTLSFPSFDFAHQSISAILPSSGGLLTQIGNNTSGAIAGVITHASNPSIGYYTQVATATSNNSQAYLGMVNSSFYRGLGFHYSSTLNYPDTNYGAGTTGTRIGLGLVDVQPWRLIDVDVIDASHPYNGCGFQYSTTRGDTNWQFLTFNGVAQTTVNTGMVFSPLKLYQFDVVAAPNSQSIDWQIKNITDNTIQVGSATTNLPPIGTGLLMMAGIRTLNGGVARKMQSKRIYGATPI